MEESRRAAVGGANSATSCPADGCDREINMGTIERAASVALGVAATLAGLNRGGTTGLLLAGIGAAALYRGISGHCYGYEALGIDTTEHPDATVLPVRQRSKIGDLRSLDRVLQDADQPTPVATYPPTP